VSATLPTDEFSALPVLRASHKIRSFDLGDASRHQVRPPTLFDSCVSCVVLGYVVMGGGFAFSPFAL
jgi:hypothetical protein